MSCPKCKGEQTPKISIRIEGDVAETEAGLENEKVEAVNALECEVCGFVEQIGNGENENDRSES